MSGLGLNGKIFYSFERWEERDKEGENEYRKKTTTTMSDSDWIGLFIIFLLLWMQFIDPGKKETQHSE